MNKKIWYITGSSKGLGLALVKQLLQAGYWVAATSRSIKALQILNQYVKRLWVIL